MAQFQIGSKVIETNSGKHGTVVGVDPYRRGRQTYKVTFEKGEVETKLEADLHADFDLSDPFERCKSGIFGSYSEYSKKNTTFKISNSNNSTISSLKASKTLFRAYQFKPLLKFLNSPNRRLLVADEVGLGKTIEAGHIMLELKARRELRNVLIICPMSLQAKWKAELFEKFGLSFKIYDSNKDLITDLQDHAHDVHAIINYEKIRMPRSKEKDDEGPKTPKSKETTNLVSYLTESSNRFSLVLCDEAHKMRNRETQTYKGAEIIMSTADAALFLTATPVMISEENLYNLLHLLDNTRYFNYQIFLNRMAENRPFVEALTCLNNDKMPLKDILTQLVTSIVEVSFSANDSEIYSSKNKIADLFQNDPVFKEIIELMKGEEDTKKIRARLQYLLSSMSVMNTVFSRTRKREVTTDMSQAERSPHACKVDLHKDEQEEFDRVINDYTDDNSYVDDWGEERMSFGKMLGLVQRKRQIASSVYGFLNDEEDLDKGIDRYQNYPDAKVEMLAKIINEVWQSGTKKLVVFAVFRRTLKYLSIRLKKLGFNALIIHGQIENRAELLHQFKTDPNIQVLLSSEVGSEGLDMQFCNSMVNYDLPWNPMVVEQRIGRIDRFGQKAKVVNIYNIVVAGSIQEEIYMRLLERIGIFKGTIGDMEAILDAPVNGGMSIQDVYNKMEKEFFTKDLSAADRERKISEVERAIENEKENLQHLQEGLSNTLTNDAYFRDEINRILYNNAYVTEQELQNYLESVIRQKLTTCSLESVKKGIMEFRVAQSDANALRNFLAQYEDHTSDENRINASLFKRKVEDTQKFLLTFSQEAAYDDPTLAYLNIYHPMIQACLNYFKQNDDQNKTSFSYSLRSDELLHEGEVYYMGLYQLTTSRMVQGVKKTAGDLLPVVYNIANDELVEDQEIIDRIYRRSQIEGSERNASNSDVQAEIIENMTSDFTFAVSEEKKRRIEESTRQIESDRQRNIQQTMEYYKSRIENHKNNISNWEDELQWNFDYLDDKEIRSKQGAIRLAKANISMLEKERDERIDLIKQDTTPTIEDKILSINLVTII